MLTGGSSDDDDSDGDAGEPFGAAPCFSADPPRAHPLAVTADAATADADADADASSVEEAVLVPGDLRSALPIACSVSESEIPSVAADGTDSSGEGFTKALVEGPGGEI